jgi:hypothetical protein
MRELVEYFQFDKNLENVTGQRGFLYDENDTFINIDGSSIGNGSDNSGVTSVTGAYVGSYFYDNLPQSVMSACGFQTFSINNIRCKTLDITAYKGDARKLLIVAQYDNKVIDTRALDISVNAIDLTLPNFEFSSGLSAQNITMTPTEFTNNWVWSDLGTPLQQLLYYPSTEESIVMTIWVRESYIASFLKQLYNCISTVNDKDFSGYKKGNLLLQSAHSDIYNNHFNEKVYKFSLNFIYKTILDDNGDEVSETWQKLYRQDTGVLDTPLYNCPSETMENECKIYRFSELDKLINYFTLGTSVNDNGGLDGDNEDGVFDEGAL